MKGKMESRMKKLTKAFRAFCDGKEYTLSKYEVGYLRHCLACCIDRPCEQHETPQKGCRYCNNPNTSGHPLFMLWSIQRSPKLVAEFLEHSGKRYGGGEK